VLEPQLAPRSPSTFIRRNERRQLWFDPQDRWWTDVLEVQKLSAAAKDAEGRRDSAAAIDLYEQLVAYYRLTFLPEDVYEDVFAAHRSAHEITHAESLHRLMDLYLRTGQFPGALSSAMQVLAVDPYSEDAVKAIVHVYLRQGNFTGAIRQLDEFLDAVKQHVGLTPDNELISLRRNILLAR
jgi:DNA-binding SARP family transcriptional activator